MANLLHTPNVHLRSAPPHSCVAFQPAKLAQIHGPQCTKRRRSIPPCPAQPSNHDAESFDVSDVVINPSFRTAPGDADTSRTTVAILFISESGVCRAALAAAAFSQALADAGVAGEITCAGAASRDYNVGDPVDPTVALAAAELDIHLDPDYRVRQFEEAKDVASFDAILVMDKFTAADVLREISVFDTICPTAFYSSKVRRLAEFHPDYVSVSGMDSSDDQDIGDPLYGNFGGDAELRAVMAAGTVIAKSCTGLVEYLITVRDTRQEEGFRAKVAGALQDMGGIDWLVPPMLQKR